MNLQTVKSNLEQRNFKVQIFNTVEKARIYLSTQINNTTVGLAGSVTLKEMEVFELLETNNQVWWHNNFNQASEYGEFSVREKAANTEIYISSVNAMSVQGQLINIDATGNRIASTVFGHKKVYYILGKNKIEDTFEKALWRARNISAPQNAKRINAKTPCAIKADKCYDCKSPNRICRSFMITEYPMFGQETEIIIINGNLGY